MHMLKKVSEISHICVLMFPLDHFSTKTAFGVLLFQEGHLNNPNSKHFLWGKIKELGINQFLEKFSPHFFSSIITD